MAKYTKLGEFLSKFKEKLVFNSRKYFVEHSGIIVPVCTKYQGDVTLLHSRFLLNSARFFWDIKRVLAEGVEEWFHLVVIFIREVSLNVLIIFLNYCMTL